MLMHLNSVMALVAITWAVIANSDSEVFEEVEESTSLFEFDFTIPSFVRPQLVF